MRKIRSSIIISVSFLILSLNSVNAGAYIASTQRQLKAFTPQWYRGFDDSEIELLLKIQQEASTTAIEQAKKEDTFSLWIFSDVLGPNFHESKLPISAPIFLKIISEIGQASSFLKNEFKRDRPPFKDSRVQSPVEVSKSAAYPSGHATQGMAWAIILSDLKPAMKDQLFSFGRGVGWHRLVLGVHYPSDVIAGFRLGRELGNQVVSSSLYKMERSRILAEWKKAGLVK